MGPPVYHSKEIVKSTVQAGIFGQIPGKTTCPWETHDGYTAANAGMMMALSRRIAAITKARMRARSCFFIC